MVRGKIMFEARRQSTVPRVTGLVVSLMLLAACTQPVKKEAAEETWPTLVEPAEDCSDISGLYSASPRVPGEAQLQQTPLLAYTLLPASPRLAGTEYVHIEITPAQLEITASIGATPVLSATYAADSGVFECLSGTLEFRPAKKPGAAAGSTPTGLDWETIHLRRTQDGSLLLQKADGLANLAFMLFPIYLTTKNWYLFKPAGMAPAHR